MTTEKPVELRREQRVMLELHRTLVEQLAADPERVLARARVNLERSAERLNATGGSRWVQRWRQAIQDGQEAVAALALMPGDEGDDLRQVAPFVGVLSQEQRLAAIARASVAAA